MPNKSFELRRCLNYKKSNYRESIVQFEFDHSIQKEMIDCQSFSNNFSVNLNDSVCKTLQVKLLRKSYIPLVCEKVCGSENNSYFFGNGQSFFFPRIV